MVKRVALSAVRASPVGVALPHAHQATHAHTDSAGSKDNSHSIVRLETRRAELLGKVQRFRDQGEAFCRVADYLLVLERRQEAEGYFERARKIAEAHGFFSVECAACLGLGKLAVLGGRQEEGVELMRKNGRKEPRGVVICQVDTSVPKNSPK